MFDIYSKYTPDEIKDAIGWKNGVTTDDLSGAVMVLCDIIQRQAARIEKLEKAEAANSKSARDLSAHLNGMTPD